MLRNPDNPARWSDGKLRSQGNAFDVAYTPDARTTDHHNARHERDNAKRARRIGVGLVDVESKKSAVKHGGAHSKAGKK